MFNVIIVDSDIFIFDMLLLGVMGVFGVEIIEYEGFFVVVLYEVMLDFVYLVVCDGEGVMKFVEILVIGVGSDQDVKIYVLVIVNFLLVKIVIVGEDFNWGCIVMVIGKFGVVVDCDLLIIYFGDVFVVEKGWVVESYFEEVGVIYMKV